MKYLAEACWLLGHMAQHADLRETPTVAITAESKDDYHRLIDFMKANWDTSIFGDMDPMRRLQDGHTIDLNGIKVRIAKRDR